MVFDPCRVHFFASLNVKAAGENTSEPPVPGLRAEWLDGVDPVRPAPLHLKHKQGDVFMNNPNPPIIYSPIGHCIYCGSTEGDFSKEHIIPLGLGGNFILPKASCPACGTITGEVERFCLKLMYGPLRNRLKLPTRHKKERSDNLPLELRKPDGSKEFKIIPSENFPAIAMGFNFPAPGILRNIKPNEACEGTLIAHYIDAELQEYMKTEGLRVKLGSISILIFCQMLAKIAHSFAIANLGEKAFHPLLSDLILGKSITPQYLVGGDVSAILPEQKNVLHDIFLQNCLSNGIEYTLVGIRLFAFMGMPRYHVVVGEKL
ncbi:MAG: HNH endonuclease [Anaerolineae bacterium]|nr:HNH endonuclease [Anaerolineae bacterium]